MKHLLLTTIVAVLVVGCGNPEADRALLDAANNGNIELIMQALNDGANVNAIWDTGETENTPLHMAAFQGNNEIVELLIAKGANLEAKDRPNGGTPLFDAAQYGRKEVTELLIAKGADVNPKRSRMGTPLHGAVRYEHKKIVELLITNGADVNAKYVDGTTPLDLAIKRKKIEIANLLRKHGGKTREELKAEDK